MKPLQLKSLSVSTNYISGASLFKVIREITKLEYDCEVMIIPHGHRPLLYVNWASDTLSWEELETLTVGTLYQLQEAILTEEERKVLDSFITTLESEGLIVRPDFTIGYTETLE